MMKSLILKKKLYIEVKYTFPNEFRKNNKMNVISVTVEL
jgi:hypothetical protein